MARYFFHLTNVDTIADEVGEEFDLVEEGQERAASARMNVCGTFPRSMPHLTGARSLGHQPNVQISFYV
jgi:hypothetical protein